MAVNIAEHYDITALQSLFDHELDSIYLWVNLRQGCYPLAIQVLPRDRAPVVSNYHTIRVEHGHDFEDKVVPQVSSALIIAYKVVEDAVHDV